MFSVEFFRFLVPNLIIIAGSIILMVNMGRALRVQMDNVILALSAIFGMLISQALWFQVSTLNYEAAWLVNLLDIWLDTNGIILSATIIWLIMALRQAGSDD